MADRRPSFAPASSSGGSLSAREPSYRENLAELIASAGRGLGLDAYRAGDVGERVTGLAEWSPLGLLTSYDDAQRAAGAGDVPGAAIGALGAIPFAGKAGRGLGALEKLPGAPSHVEGPVAEVVKAAEEYAARAGIDLKRQASYGEADPRRGRYIANAYEKMPHAPDDPKVKAAYQALASETMGQWQALQDAGAKIEFLKPGDPDPYPGGPREALADLRANHHLYVLPTSEGFGSFNEALPDNPLLADTGIVHGDHPMVVNDAFRAVHDYFGHGMEGANFGARGEENAWRAHQRLFSPEALPALTTETRGQNSWVNFGPYGDANRANQRDTVFADQKTGLLPGWASREGGMPLGYRVQQAALPAALASALALAGSAEKERRGPDALQR